MLLPQCCAGGAFGASSADGPGGGAPAGSRAGTGKAFGMSLVELMAGNSKLAIVSLDLASSCGINAAVHHKNFYEIGVAEQDGVSFAGGG